MTESRARFLLGIGIPAAALAVTIVPYVLFQSDLPDRVATHFDGSGTPDGSMTPISFLLFSLAMVLAGVACCLWLARSTRLLPASAAPIVGFLGGFFAGLGSGIALVTFVSQRGLSTWQDAANVWTLIAVPLLLSVTLGAVAARAATALPAAQVVIDPESSPVMDLAPGQTAVWAETLHSALLAHLGAGVMAVGVVVALLSEWTLVFPVVIIGVLMLSLATLRVKADRQGLHVRYGMLPWPRTNLEVGEMATASVIDVRPMEWGGWGYRGSLTLMKQAAVVHRAGPGIRLDLKNGKVFVVTVDNPETPVALLNGEIARLANGVAA